MLSVRNNDRCIVHDTLACCPCPSTEINIFKKQEESRIESPEFFIEGTTQQQARSRNPIDFPGWRDRACVLCLRCIRRGIARYAPTPLNRAPPKMRLCISCKSVGKQIFEDRPFDEYIRNTRKCACRIPHHPARKDKLRRKNADRGIALHDPDHLRQSIGGRDVIGINNEEILTGGIARSKIIPFAVSEIFFSLRYPHPGIFG